MKAAKSWWPTNPTPDDDAEESLLGGERISKPAPPRHTIRRHLAHRWPWALSTLLFACTTAVLFVKSLPAVNPTSRSCDPWRKTDFGPARQLIKEHEVRFDGALTYNETGALIRESAPDGKDWIGDPTPEMDRLWDHVEAGSMILLEGWEADMVRDKTIFFDGYWLTGLDVIHQMHCLNKVRKALYPEYYKPEQSDRTERLHVEHCFDYIRQAVMCNADISPVTHRWFESVQTSGPDFHTTHTCRDFDRLLDWSLERTTKATKKKGPGMETARDPKQVIPGSFLDPGSIIDEGHGSHHAH